MLQEPHDDRHHATRQCLTAVAPDWMESTGQQQSRGRFLKKAACAAVSLSGLIATAPFILGGNSASAEVPALAEGEVRTTTFVAPALAAEEKFEYFKFDVQLSEGETGSFTVEVRPGEKMTGGSAWLNPRVPITQRSQDKRHGDAPPLGRSCEMSKTLARRTFSRSRAHPGRPRST